MPRARIEGEAAPRGVSAIGDHIPFIVTLAALPSMPRWQLARIANRAIECLDASEPDTDLEPNGDEQDYSVAGWIAGRHGDEAEDAENDDDREEDDHGGGNVDDEGEPEEGDGIGFHGTDQREIRHWGGEWREA